MKKKKGLLYGTAALAAVCDLCGGGPVYEPLQRTGEGERGGGESLSHRPFKCFQPFL